MPAFDKSEFEYDDQQQQQHMMTGGLAVPSEDRGRPLSPAPTIASALLEEGLLKTVDVPGYDIAHNDDNDDDGNNVGHETLTAGLVHGGDSAAPVVWQDDTLAIFHFSLYTLRPGNKQSVDSPAAAMMADNGMDDAIAEEEEEEEEEEDAHSALPNVTGDTSEKDKQEEEEEEEEETEQYPAYAMAALQRRMSAFSLEPPLAIVAQPALPSFDDDHQSDDDDEPAETATHDSVDSGVCGVQPDDDQEHVTNGITSPERVVIRELVRDTRTTPHGRPFELRIGRGFTAAALEMAVKSMRVGEQSRFLLRRECTEHQSTRQSVEPAIPADGVGIVRAGIARAAQLEPVRKRWDSHARRYGSGGKANLSMLVPHFGHTVALQLDANRFAVTA
ncbi:hypothetical protein SYNPS1DRAFT_30690 [Syncephalis pseudoplumigaleata]|uniref:Uncharacterized protein n=1 Tax=Syncephalis pseudoplumigaleata TaxID=1712513 RepID=A0A4P9YUB1_9FUNG|nr:hypothetical protein SYNPS1DRAFT_30690 [Syncephalis pseudoplumigaleata]|eukprot:RKP23556.1 hypothetical protein SYNPS1DRAFT_30690 [Syncephalis pseudoplumigaleata]